MQILVVVASIQMRTLNAEVEEVSVLTVFAHGLVGPKKQRNCVECCGFRLSGLAKRPHELRKGIWLIFQNLSRLLAATQVITPTSMAPLRRVLFSSLDDLSPRMTSSRDRVQRVVEHFIFCCVGCGAMDP